MEKFTALFKLGIKYLYRYRRRYSFLLASLVFCFAVVTLITSVKDGMYDSVYYSVQSHYAGDIVAVGYYSDSNQRYLGETEINALLDAAQTAGINPRYTVLRSFGVGGIIYHNGTAVELKYLQGCDWETEGESYLFGKMNFAEAPDSFPGDDGIIISVPTAKQLYAGIGDNVTVEVTTRTGQKNTRRYTIKGIIEDSSIFGYYKAYVSRLSLNRLILYGDSDCSSLGFFLDDPGAVEQKRNDLWNVLSAKIQTGPLVRDREEMDNETGLSWEGIKTLLVTLPVYMSEISDLLDALNILSYFLYGMMLLIILVSAVVTYRLILHERTKELGVMRAIGFYGGDLRLVLWTEIIALGIISLGVGFFLALLMTRGLALLSFDWFPGFEIFMKNGKLAALFLPRTTLVNVLSIFVILFAAVVFPAFRASRKNLPGLLSGEPL